MNNRSQKFIVIFFIMFGMFMCAQAANEPMLGHVSFTVSCKPSSQAKFNRAMALFHHMMYDQSENIFNDILNDDPTCSMAYWGIAITQIHPLWAGGPSHKTLAKGETALQKAAASTSLTVKERAFVDAAQAMFKNGQTVSYEKSISNWWQAQKQLYLTYPNDPEAIALYTLLHLATAPKADKSYKHQQEAGLLLESLHQQWPQHPAGFHYLIHAYDNPKFAQKVEAVARNYDKIAPNVPHALHMPSHIFVRLGLWNEVIRWNRRSADAAKNQPLAGNIISKHYAHAIDYLVYGYLQIGEDAKAALAINEIDFSQHYQHDFTTAYGLTAPRLRYALERNQWQEAMSIPVPDLAPLQMGEYPSVLAMIDYTHGIAAARLAKSKQAKAAIKRCDKHYQQLKKEGDEYWAIIVDAQRKSIQAWNFFNEGKHALALTLMTKAADIEDAVDKHPVTPGAIYPARELLGDMLLLMNKPREALLAYQEALKVSPNRKRSVLGVAAATVLINNSVAPRNDGLR